MSFLLHYNFLRRYRVQGWGSVCWGVLGTPYLKIEQLVNLHFMFFIDMRFISNILKIFLRGSSSLPVQIFEIPFFETLTFYNSTVSKFPMFKCPIPISTIPHFQFPIFFMFHCSSSLQISNFDILSCKTSKTQKKTTTIRYAYFPDISEFPNPRLKHMYSSRIPP